MWTQTTPTTASLACCFIDDNRLSNTNRGRSNRYSLHPDGNSLRLVSRGKERHARKGRSLGNSDGSRILVKETGDLVVC